MIDGISDDRKIALSKLEHIMLGTVNKRVSGFHCNIDCNNDTKVEIYGKPKYSSNGIRRYNGEKRIFEASVKSKPKKTKIVYKKDKSSFFCQEWSRQKVVNFIYRINTSGILMKKYTPPKKYMENSIYMDRKTSLIVVNCDATTYPLTRL